MTPALTENVSGVTMGGTFNSNRIVTLHHLKLPDICPHTTLLAHTARVFDAPCKYDMILGRDILNHFKIKLNFADTLIECNSNSVPMPNFPQDFRGPADLAQQLYLDTVEPKNLLDAFAFGSTPEILAADYKPADVRAVVDNCTHLNASKKEALYNVLKDFSDVFDGKLRHYPDEEIHLDVDPTAQPHRSRAYPIPRSQLKRFKQELDRLVTIGVLSPQGRSSWISGSFIIPKKDNTVRWISDFRGLNKALKRKVYPIPRIQDILSRRSGYKFLSKLDISMQYYTFVLDDESKELCTIATPFGLYKYNRLPMGISQSPDIAQEVMENVLRDIDDIEVYIDDIAVFSSDFDQHLAVIRKILTRLRDKGFIANPRKCEWCIEQTDFLGHWLTPDGIKPYSKKIKAILNMQEPKNIKQLRAFLGLVTYYRDMWPRRSHILAPLTDLLKTPKTFKWEPCHREAFLQMKAIIETDTLLTYPDHNKPFHIETDASDFQLGAVIKQNNKAVAYYTRKLNSAQRNYTTIEKELLSVVETLKEFRSMLLGSEIHVYTDHRNLTHKLSSFTTQRVLRWRLLLEEYNPTFNYIKGKDNVVADALSRTPTTTCFADFQTDNKDPEMDPFVFTNMADGLMALPTCVAQNRSSTHHNHNHYVDDIYLFHPNFPGGRHPFQFTTINHYQQKDDKVRNLPVTDPSRYFLKHFDNIPIICRHDNLKTPLPASWKILLPTAMLRPTVDWYHEATVHSTGMDRLEALLRRHYWHPNLRQVVRDVISRCPICPQVRQNHMPHGQLAPRNAPILPWHEVHIDFIGPWTIRVNNQDMVFNALTCIDPVTNLVEIVRLKGEKNGLNAKRLFENHWLSRYPRPQKVIHDHGPEFQNHEFQFNLLDAGIHSVNISPNTPTANSICEASHKAIGQVIRTLIHTQPPDSQQAAEHLVDNAIASAMHALRCNPVTTLGNYSPGALVFNRDMFLNIPLVADILTLTQHRQALVDKRLLRANARRSKHEFRVGQMVFVNESNTRANKLMLIRKGPFPIIQIHTNNTVTIDRDPIHERINIRRLTPSRIPRPAQTAPVQQAPP